MYYMIYAQDVENSLEKRLKVRPDHLTRVNELVNQGRLLIAGPTPAIDTEDPGPAGFTGSLIVAKFDSLDEAQAWANADPYFTAGVYEKVTVKPYKLVLP